MRYLAILAVCCTTISAQSLNLWTVARSTHFEVYSQTLDQTAQKALLWFEQMRSFFEKDGLQLVALNDESNHPLRIIGFRSEEEYSPYRLRPLASAYYSSGSDRDYIVMDSLQPARFGVAAHEYSHFVLHSGSLKLPSCLQEGLAEVFATLRLTSNGFELGGDLPSRSRVLQANRQKLLPMAQLLSRNEEASFADRSSAELFYAQSWALADLLVSSPKFSARLPQLAAAFQSGQSPVQAFQGVYGISLQVLDEEIKAWLAAPHSPRLHPSQPLPLASSQVSQLSEIQTKDLFAQLSLISGHIEQAKSRYQELALLEPANPDFRVALGAIALRQGNRGDALSSWRLAVQGNVKDPAICFRYAVLAEEAGLDQRDIKAALEHAVQLSPSFDEARFHLALVDSHLSEFQLAVQQLRKMALPKGSRLYTYWIAMASALLELNENTQANQAALEAVKAAQNDSDRSAAMRLSYMANTEMHVQLATDSDGAAKMVTTRSPRGAANWNPFIEPSDFIKHASGKLAEVLCTNGKLTGFLVRSSEGAIALDVPDPSRVQMRNSPNEFYCGPLPKPAAVEADYALSQSSSGKTKNILRGMAFDE